MPVTPCVVAVELALREADRRDPSTPGTSQTRSWRFARERREAIGVLDDEVAVEALVDRSRPIVSFAPAAKIDAKVTSATPTISAAAVTAVRPGWRTLFSRARRPVMPQALERRADDAGDRPDQLRAQQRDAEERRRRAEPRERQRRSSSRLTANSPSASITSAADRQDDRQRGRPDASARLGQRDALAQRGHRRHARRPQRRGERRDQRDDRADDQRDDDRPRLDHRALRRQVDAEGVEHRLQPVGDEDRRARGRRASPSAPIVKPFGQHRAQHLAARGAERAQQRELARALRDRDRERVEDDERADEQRDPGERQQRGRQEAEVVLDVAGLLVGLLLAGAHVDVAGTAWRDPRCAAASASRPAWPATVDLVVAAVLARHPLRLGQRHQRDRRRRRRSRRRRCSTRPTIV